MAGEAVAAGQITKNIFISTKSFVENKTDVPGLGEEAYYGGSGLKAGAGLHILVNDNTSINISVGLGLGNDNREEHLADEKKLAQIILPQL